MKKRTTILASLLSVTTLSAIAASSAFAFDKGSTDGVVGVLLKKYTLTETTMDKTQITHDGVQLSMKQAGVYSFPAKGYLNVEMKVQDGKVQKPNILVQASCSKAHCHVLQSGEKVYVTKIESKNDDLKFNILSVEDIDGGDGAERYSATVTFKLKKGLLNEGSPEDIEQIVETVLGPADDSGGDAKQETASSNAPAPAPAPAPIQRAAAPPPPPPAAPAAPPPALSIGESSSQVLQAYGMPTKIVDLGKKKTFFYKDIKVIFTDDKISDMQPL
jgi:hypothetical protein